ncbi:alcohol dehydrogenase catalytic domain-containing protein [Ornithinimicrobium sp. F0845]|uniref:zinc-binding dehydrogenase n=1 Tax=Ornithinimicrobium sp. F0845 TaxID=2926412 RepID=UPI001FF2B07F|nr:alcohol dehydrogenase catalytic domain-containing protein [Ornithinimicrobium sp. F0845]MCK0112606.1 alcohol dehydrogenase catalytic domain-containing protein [Ornithinimicrobium sp. F0845]
MRAVVWNGPGTPMTVEEVPVPRPLAGEALVRVAATGVCHTDLHVIKGEVAFPAPGVLGHEISGHVETLGDGVTGLAVGDRVVGAFIMPCGTCRQCAAGRDDMCEPFFEQNRLRGNLFDGTSRLARADGSRLSMYSMGGFAEYAVVPVTGLTRLPEGLPLEESAVLGCAAFTAYGAVSRAGADLSGRSVAVVAVGGVGSSVLQFARHLGADPLIAVDVDDAKLEAARALGATVTVNSRSTDAREAVLEATGGAGVEVALEVLGRPETVELGLSLLREGGQLVLVGIAAGAATADLPITQVVRRGLTVTGSYGARTRQDLPEVVRLAAEGAFDVRRAVTRRFPLEEAPAAYDLLDAGAIQGRSIVTMG